MRGGSRPRLAEGGSLLVYVIGRWGRRRVCVTECAFTLTAEDVYSALLEDGAARCRPGAAGELHVSHGGRRFAASWEIRPNAVWRCGGRVFLRCGMCGGRAARLYLPAAQSRGLGCRRCYGLTYASRARLNYKGGAAGSLLVAQATIDAARQARRAGCRERWAERRAWLR